MPRSPRRSARSRASKPAPTTAPTSSKPHPATPLREALLYARVSSKDQEREGFSIPAQQALLRAYATDKGLNVLQEFVDVETAKRAGRTSFTEMVTFLRAHKTCRVLLVEKTDRLYRNLKDWVTLDEMEGLEIHLVKEGTILSDDSRSSEKFIHGIKVLMAKNYIDNLSEETRKGMIEKARQGMWPSKAPLGYRNVQRDDGKRIIEPDPVVAPLVTRLFELYGEGDISLKDLTKRAREDGLTFRRSKQPLPRTTLHMMLQNPLFIGDFEWDGVYYKGIHTPLVSRELFDRVQGVLTGRVSRGRRSQRHAFAFSGMVQCGSCRAEGHSRMLIGSLVKKQYVYYHCDRCKLLGRGKHHREAAIDTAYVGALRGLRLDDVAHQWVTTALRHSMVVQKADHSAAVARLQAEYDKLQRRIDAAYEDRLDGRIDAEFFDRKARGWREEQATVRRRLAAHEHADQGYMEAGIGLLELARRAVSLYERQDDAQKRRLLGVLHSNSYWDGDALTVDWRQPFDVLASSIDEIQNEQAPGGHSEGSLERWRGQRDSNP